MVDNLKDNLFNINQCNESYKFIFDKLKCIIGNARDGKALFIGKRCINVYSIDIDCASSHNKYYSALYDDSWLWHKRLGHVSMELILKIYKSDLVRGLLKIGF